MFKASSLRRVRERQTLLSVVIVGPCIPQVARPVAKPRGERLFHNV